MLNAQKDQLFLLIKSLNKAEKRNFKLYAKRIQGGGDAKFLQLFDVVDKMNEYDEEIILKKLPQTQKKQLPNLKRHLYKQILTSLRLIHIQKNIDIQIREQIDFARILYGKGMYMQALRILERIKKIAVDNHQDILHLEILEFQKLIEARHITRSRAVENKMENLLSESLRRSSITHETSRLSNFNIQVHGLYIEFGHARDEQERKWVKDYYNKNIPKELSVSRTTFFEKAHLYQANMWYNYILLDFQRSAKSARQMVNLFYIDPQMREKDPDLYFRALYYLLTFLFVNKKVVDFKHFLDEFESIYSQLQDDLTPNSEMLAFIYLYLSKLNFHLLQESYQEGLNLEDEIMSRLHEFEGKVDIHRLLLFRYKLGYLKFRQEKYDEALEYINEIILLKGMSLRDDLLLNSKLLQVICHFEQENFSLVDYLIPSLSRQLKKSKETSKTQLVILEGLKALNKAHQAEYEAIFEKLAQDLQTLIEDPFEKKAFIYFDASPWIEQHRVNQLLS